MSADNPQISATKTNGWVPLGVGENIPARDGQVFDLRLRRGDEAYGFVFGIICRRRSTKGLLIEHNPAINDYAYNEGNCPFDVIAYCLHEPDDAAEKARRDARIDNFRKIAALTPVEMPHPGNAQPEIPRPAIRPAPFRRHEVLNPPGVSYAASTRTGLNHVNTAIRASMLRIAHQARTYWSRRLADDLTPSERTEARAFIRELTAIIEEGLA